MRVLVTGGAGFLGRAVVQRLVNAHHEVWVLDDESTGDMSLLPDVVERILGDVAAGLPSGVRFDQIYHLACPGSPAVWSADPVKTLRTCFLGADVVLSEARGARVLLASSSEVYGQPRTHPQVEGDRGNVDTMGPRGSYDEGKRVLEALAAAYRGRVAVRVPRIFNTYGPGQNPWDARVVPTFIRQALTGEPLTIHGHGRQTRSLCFVDDLVDGLFSLMASDHDGPMNLGSDVEVTINELARRVVLLVGGGQTYTDAPSDDPVRRRPDLTLARSILAFQTKVPLDDGLQRTVDWMSGALELGNVKKGER